MNCKKHLFFYSSFCPICHEVIKDIMKKDIRGYFLFVCVEKKSIPPFVDRVPFIITNEKQFVIEDAISDFVENILTHKADTSVSCLTTGAKGYFGNDYSFIDDDINKPPQDINAIQNYVFLTDDSSITNIPNESLESHKKEKLSDSQYEEFMKKRSLEIPTIKRTAF